MKFRYLTARLTVREVFSNVDGNDREVLLSRVEALFNPAVVQHLPPAFHIVNSRQTAELWFEGMINESRVFVAFETRSETVIGLLFVHVDIDRQAHIGYLLEEDYWGRGLASELLTGFITFASKQADWKGLIGGVEKANTASSHLLQKLGFVETADGDGSTTYYRYDLS